MEWFIGPFVAIAAYIVLRQLSRKLPADLPNGSNGKILLPDLFIEYADANGVITDRAIAVISVDEKMILAWCFKRKARRHFRIDRIMRMERIVTIEEPNIRKGVEALRAEIAERLG